MPCPLSTRSWSVRAAMANHEAFTTNGSLRAVAGGTRDTGRLPEPYRTAYRDALDGYRITYTVCSYRTPVGWVLDDGSVIVPPVFYSPTTSRHQGLLCARGEPGDGSIADAADRERQGPEPRVGWVSTAANVPMPPSRASPRNPRASVQLPWRGRGPRATRSREPASART